MLPEEVVIEELTNKWIWPFKMRLFIKWSSAYIWGWHMTQFPCINCLYTWTTKVSMVKPAWRWYPHQRAEGPQVQTNTSQYIGCELNTWTPYLTLVQGMFSALRCLLSTSSFSNGQCIWKEKPSILEVKNRHQQLQEILNWGSCLAVSCHARLLSNLYQYLIPAPKAVDWFSLDQLDVRCVWGLRDLHLLFEHQPNVHLFFFFFDFLVPWDFKREIKGQVSWSCWCTWAPCPSDLNFLLCAWVCMAILHVIHDGTLLYSYFTCYSLLDTFGSGLKLKIISRGYLELWCQDNMTKMRQGHGIYM